MLTKPLVSLPEIKAFIDMRDTNVSQDEKLTALSLIATKQIELFTRRSFAFQSHTELFISRDTVRTRYGEDGFGTGLVQYAVPQTLYLMGVNVDAATVQVWYDPTHVFGADTILTVSDDYEIEDGRDSILLKVPTCYNPRSVKVTYSSGYGTADVADLSAAAPPELRQACLFQIQFLRVKSRTDNVGMSAERTASSKDRVVSTKFLSKGELTPEAVALVAHLRRLGTGRG